jgi:V/A-type H+-transporting ATPase subunit D
MALANKQNLLNFQKTIQFLKKAVELLEYKRELLIREIRKISERAFKDREKLNEYLQQAFKSLSETYLDNGKQIIKLISSSCNIHFVSTLREYSLMGIVLPEIQFKKAEGEIPIEYGFVNTSSSLDETVQAFQSALELILYLSGVEISIYRLAVELTKTQRRLNSLNKIFIPEYEEKIKTILFILEERDRESISIVKVLKSRLERECS